MIDKLYESLSGPELIRVNALESLKRELTINEIYELQEYYVRRWLYDKIHGKRRRVYQEHKAIKQKIA